MRSQHNLSARATRRQNCGRKNSNGKRFQIELSSQTHFFFYLPSFSLSLSDEEERETTKHGGGAVDVVSIVTDLMWKKVSVRGVHRERHRNYKVGGSGKNNAQKKYIYNNVVLFSVPYIPISPSSSINAF